MRKNFRRVHKNQAVNLLQIPIHGQDDIPFLIGDLVKFIKSRFPSEFQAADRHISAKNIFKRIAAKFLQSARGIFLQKRNPATEGSIAACLFQTGFKRIRGLDGAEAKCVEGILVDRLISD